MRKKLIIICCVLGLAGPCFISPDAAQAQGRRRSTSRHYVAQSAPMISPSQAASQAKKQHGGKVLSTRLREKSGKDPYYSVKILSQGKVRTVKVKAKEPR